MATESAMAVALSMVAAAALAGCGGKSGGPAPLAGSAPAVAGASTAGTAGGDAADAGDAGGDAAADDALKPPAKIEATCLPPPPSANEEYTAEYRYTLGRTGGKLVLCGSVGSGPPFACWNLDSKGTLSARAATPIPGTSVEVAPAQGCYQGMCWKLPPEDEAYMGVHIALHPDGKRAAALIGESVTIYDVASKKATTTFPLRAQKDIVSDNEVSNGPVNLWFVGETVYIHGADAGPASALFPYSVQGKAIGPAYWGVYLGAVAIDEDKLVLNDEALTKLMIFDGRAKGGKSIARKLPKTPCKDGEYDPDIVPPEDYKPGSDKCLEYRIEHLGPYVGAQIVSEGKGYVGLVGSELLTLDAKLVETGRVKLAQCAK